MLTDKPNIIVTGGCGFIGSHLVENLIDQGFFVTVVDDNRSGNYYIENENVEYHKIDVFKKQAELKSRKKAKLENILEIPMADRPNWSVDEINRELENKRCI